MVSIRFRDLIIFSAIFRVILILYGEWQDTHMKVRYTDIDYFVFSDAASLMASGSSPYQRSTYRYSPLLAFLLIPNSLLHRSWGKFLFSAAGTICVTCFHNNFKVFNFFIFGHNCSVVEKLQICLLDFSYVPF